MKQLRDKLKACQEEKAHHLEELQRAKADFLNTRKRLEIEQIRQQERVTDDHISRLLPLCDSFQMAMSNTEAWEAIDKNWRSGVEAIHGQFTKYSEGISSYGY